MHEEGVLLTSRASHSSVFVVLAGGWEGSHCTEGEGRLATGAHDIAVVDDSITSTVHLRTKHSSICEINGGVLKCKAT